MKRTKTSKKVKPKVGRPVKYEVRRMQIAARLQEPLYNQIREMADAAGRSISEQCEHLIQYALDRKSLLEGLGLLYGPELAALLLVLGDVSKETALYAGYSKTGRISQNGWIADPWVFDQVVTAATAVLRRGAPAGEVSAPPNARSLRIGDTEIEAAEAGKRIAEKYLRELVQEDADLSEHAAIMKKMLASSGLMARFKTGAEQ